MHRWKFSVLATAAILSSGLYSTDASALALGRITVQSALGEPLRAEIELPQITPAEADSLRAATASPEVFRSQGLEYSSAARNVQVKLQRRPDGSMMLRLTSTRPINEPFVDLVIDAAWNSGHIVRSYTMLFDPPATSRPQPTVTAAPQIDAPRAAPAPAPAAPRVQPPESSTSAAAQAAPRRAAAAAPAPAPATASQDNEVKVQPGDTAGRIAGAYRPEGVSLDQMLVALMRSNPDAFINGNVNRLRSGAVLQIPTEAEAQATTTTEARRIVVAQSRDFNEFRRRMAGAAPTAQVAAAQRSASGAVQTEVDDKKPAVGSPDKLTLSKGSVQAQKAEEQAARDRQASQTATRMAELSRNLQDLKQLDAASQPGASLSDAAATAASQPALAVPATVALAASTPAANASAAQAPASGEATTQATAQASPSDEPASAAAEAASAASTAQAPAPAARPAPAPAPYEEPSLIDSVLEDPLLAGGGLAIALLLLGYGGYRYAQSRRQHGAVDSSFSESRLQADSFFGASGGQRVDTASTDLTTGASSMTYSPSQLEGGGDVDPVAEADVYLAYGRDLQAEEILKEAVRHYPERVSIPAKLAEIYAKRQDRKALEAVANDVFKLTNGQGPDWARVSDLGRALDPENLLYQPGGRPATAAQGQSGAAAASAFASTIAIAQAPSQAEPGPDSRLPELDLDLDLDLHEAPPAAAPAPSTFAMAAAGNAALINAQTQALAQAPAEVKTAAAQDTGDESADPVLSLDHLDLSQPDWDRPGEPAASSAAAAPAPAPTQADIGLSPLDMLDEGLSLMDSGAAPLTSQDAKAGASEPLEFDLGSLSLDLDMPSEAPSQVSDQARPPAATDMPTPAADAPLADDPLTTKLALAEEFNTIGDSEGARTLVEEVIAESSGDLKARAQRLLAQLG
ncbi:FimV/HubP family polar landmark protein [Diaphorobacter sp.]|uniref:FimV/HubP family polar landmark protein n=1 Tax=Diaphorobacter sp. TaxID=1934310 RepID=UPI003D0D963C